MSHAVKTRSEKATLAARRTVCYAALVLLSFFMPVLLLCAGHQFHPHPF